VTWLRWVSGLKLKCLVSQWVLRATVTNPTMWPGRPGHLDTAHAACSDSRTGGVTAVQWDIRREDRAWSADEFRSRWDLTPEKLEVIRGKLLWEEDERLNLLAMLLENVGMDAAVGLGSVELWEEAVAARRSQQLE